MDQFRELALHENWLLEDLTSLAEKLSAHEVDWQAMRSLVSDLIDRLSLYDVYSVDPGRPKSDALEEILSRLRFVTSDLSPRVLSIPQPQPATLILPGNRASARIHAKKMLEIVTTARSNGSLAIAR
jgi:hypothetical protein